MTNRSRPRSAVWRICAGRWSSSLPDVRDNKANAANNPDSRGTSNQLAAGKQASNRARRLDSKANRVSQAVSKLNRPANRVSKASKAGSKGSKVNRAVNRSEERRVGKEC